MNETTQFLASHGLPLLFAVVFIEQLGLPIPALPWLLLAGALSAAGKLNLALAIAVTVIACLLSDIFWFSLGRYRGKRVLGLLRRISPKPESCVPRTQKTFSKQGLIAVLFAKFVPGMATLAPPLAGLSRISFARFLYVDVVGSLLYALCWLSVGYLFREQIDQIGTIIARIGGSVLIGTVTLILGYGLLRYARNKHAQKPTSPIEDATSRKTTLAVAKQPSPPKQSDLAVATADLRPR
jgi:membrane protein DedA with SNARE-associated domain